MLKVFGIIFARSLIDNGRFAHYMRTPLPSSGIEKTHVAKKDGHGGDVLWDNGNIAVEEVEDKANKIVDLYM
jgi:hypothetical protein